MSWANGVAELLAQLCGFGTGGKSLQAKGVNVVGKMLDLMAVVYHYDFMTYDTTL